MNVTMRPVAELVPAGLQLPVGEVTDAWPTANVVHKSGRRATSIQQLGLAYEKKALGFLRDMLPGMVVHPWFGYRDRTGMRACQPDAYLIDGERLFIFEIKLRHTAMAWWQVERLYRPVLSRVFADKTIFGIEMTKSYDGRDSFPVKPMALFSYGELLEWTGKPAGFAVWQWRPE